jgi:acyl-CoA synthetase (AMP-forming)/AMP-acid ligase II/acyl carrier protein
VLLQLLLEAEFWDLCKQVCENEIEVELKKTNSKFLQIECCVCQHYICSKMINFLSKIEERLTDCSSIIDLVKQRAVRRPTMVGFTVLQDGESLGANAETSLTYQSLDQHARAIAAVLQSRLYSLAAKDDQFAPRALLLYPPGLEFITAFLGCLYAGIIAVPVYPPRRNQKFSRLQAIAADSQAAIALTTTSLLNSIERQFTESPELAALPCLATDNLASDQAGNWQEPVITPESVAFLQYTSGSTGIPKGVIVTHGNVLSNSEYLRESAGLSAESISVTWLPSFHDMGLIDGVIQPLYSGFRGILMSPVSFLRQPISWLRAISHYRASHCGGPNFAYELCVNKVTSAQMVGLDLSCWRNAYNGSEPLRRDTLERFAAKFQPCGFESRFLYPCYGMAESTLMITGGLDGAEPIYCSVQADALEQHRVVEGAEPVQVKKWVVGCGRTWLDTKVVIVNPETLIQCGPHQVGEIWVSSSSVAQGYWNRPELTQQIFQAYLADTQEGPFLRTGDLGFLSHGELFVTGRIKDVIIIRGRNHYPQDIELTVEQCHPALRAGCGAAFSMPEDEQEHLVIVQEVERSCLRSLDVDSIVVAIRRAVSEQHELHVQAVSLLKPGSILKTSSGKIQRQACKASFLKGDLQVVGHWSAIQEDSKFSEIDHECNGSWPADEDVTVEQIQNWLKDWLSRKLHIAIAAIEVGTSFADYGLDSVLAVELAQNLQDWLHPTPALTATIAWDFPSIAALATSLAREGREVVSTPDLTGHSDQLLAAVKLLNDSLSEISAVGIQQLSEEELSRNIATEIAALDRVLKRG